MKTYTELIKKIAVSGLFTSIALIFLTDLVSAQFISTAHDRVRTPLKIDMQRIGTIEPRTTNEIESSRITVGCETIDRDLLIWKNYIDYLPLLGVKKIRLQAG